MSGFNAPTVEIRPSGIRFIRIYVGVVFGILREGETNVSDTDQLQADIEVAKAINRLVETVNTITSILAKAILELERNGGLSGSTKGSLKALAEDGKGPYG